jgi:hypothetical protein
MGKQIIVILALGSLLILMGCAQATVKPVVVVVPAVEGTATIPPESQVIVITATPDTAEGGVVFSSPTSEGQQQAPSATSEVPVAATVTTGSTGITITGINDMGNGRAMVHWEAHGEFASGFQVVWSSTDDSPTYPEDTHSYYSDPAARAGMISGDYGKIYYVKVCRVINDTCDTYSNLGIVALFPPTITPTIVHTPRTASSGSSGSANATFTSYNSAGTAVSASSVIMIVKMTKAGTDKAYIEWTSSGAADKGFKIVYSKTDTTPTVGENKYYSVGKDERYAYVDGVSGYTYYYRVCRSTSASGCDIYSATYKYTFDGATPTKTPKSSTTTPTPSKTPDGSTIAIDSFTDTTLGHATLAWTAIGDFTDGFKVLSSITNATPTMSDIVVIAGSGDSSATVIGIPGMTYYFRVCKYTSGGCTIYSSVKKYSFAAEITLTVVDNAGAASLTWTNTGTDPADGYKILRDDGTADPVLFTDGIGTTVVGDLSYDDSTVVSGSTYTYRVCGYDTTDLTSCSLPQTYTVP